MSATIKVGDRVRYKDVVLSKLAGFEHGRVSSVCHPYVMVKWSHYATECREWPGNLLIEGSATQ